MNWIVVALSALLLAAAGLGVLPLIIGSKNDPDRRGLRRR